MTLSERRLHPLSFLFDIVGHLQQLIVPVLVVLVGAGSAGWGWQSFLVLLLIPYSVLAIIRTLSFRYRFDESELVITTGFIFRNQRHVPYARIHNVDAVQNVLHRLLRVVEVRVETGGGDEPEARMRVIPFDALAEVRERVSAGRQLVGTSSGEASLTPATPRRTLLKLQARDLLLAGFIESRGLVIVGAAFGLLWEAGLFDPTMDMVLGEDASGRGLGRLFLRALVGEGPMPLSRIALMVLVGASILLVVRALSMGWSFIRLYGFTLDRADHDLRAEFGLVTRVMATIPLHRIQTLTIREGPLHRFFDRVSIRVDSAGSEGGEGVTAKRESLAPIVSRQALPQLLHEVLPEVDLAKVEWQPVDPGGFRRALKGSLVIAAFLTVPLVLTLKWWTLVWMAMLVVWAWFNARQYVRNLGWALTDPAFATESDPQPAEDLRNGAVLFRSGWLWKHLTVARITKIQAVTLNESPFDRRWRMASVRVDTAGASDLSHRVDIPYLAASTATRLYSQLSSQAARTTFRW